MVARKLSNLNQLSWRALLLTLKAAKRAMISNVKKTQNRLSHTMKSGWAVSIESAVFESASTASHKAFNLCLV